MANLGNLNFGYQLIYFQNNIIGTSPTGLNNDATIYNASVNVDDGVPQIIAITGSAAQIFTTLLNEINNDITGAVASFVDGNIKITSTTDGSISQSSIVTIDGPPSNLFSSLLNFSTIQGSVDGGSGTIEVEFNGEAAVTQSAPGQTPQSMSVEQSKFIDIRNGIWQNVKLEMSCGYIEGPISISLTPPSPGFIAGTIIEDMLPVARTVRVYLRSDGSLLNVGTSNIIDGTFSIPLPSGLTAEQVYIVALGDISQNAQIFDKVTPVEI